MAPPSPFFVVKVGDYLPQRRHSAAIHWRKMGNHVATVQRKREVFYLCERDNGYETMVSHVLHDLIRNEPSHMGTCRPSPSPGTEGVYFLFTRSSIFLSRDRRNDLIGTWIILIGATPHIRKQNIINASMVSSDIHSSFVNAGADQCCTCGSFAHKTLYVERYVDVARKARHTN
ncbi:hypothetical protein BX666DRAFT_1876165 [Dichotomocladium elegans]|nr:hypothetical protein BX666DRAFT_1876165 [Dichotomocladium elegans]